jgi:hypothetical protein
MHKQTQGDVLNCSAADLEPAADGIAICNGLNKPENCHTTGHAHSAFNEKNRGPD